MAPLTPGSLAGAVADMASRGVIRAPGVVVTAADTAGGAERGAGAAAAGLARALALWAGKDKTGEKVGTLV